MNSSFEFYVKVEGGKLFVGNSKDSPLMEMATAAPEVMAIVKSLQTALEISQRAQTFDKVILFSGSRDISPDARHKINEFVQRAAEINALVMCGDAPGVDTMVASAAVVAGAQLCVVAGSKSRMENGQETGLTYSARDRFMVDLADVVVAFWNGKSNGTREVMEYAKAQGKPTHSYLFASSNK